MPELGEASRRRLSTPYPQFPAGDILPRQSGCLFHFRKGIQLKADAIFRTILVACTLLTPARAASDREVAEWVIRWDGRLMLEGVARPVNNLAELPPGDLRIRGVDLTGAVMVP